MTQRVSELEGYAAAQTKVASTGDGMRTSNDNATKSVLRANEAFAKLERSIDPVIKANAQLADDQRKVQRGLNDGSIEAGRAASVSRSSPLAMPIRSRPRKRARKPSTSIRRPWASTACRSWISPHVMKAFADEVVAGQSPLRAMAMEGGRIGQIFASGSGGAGGTLAAFGGIVTRFVLNPITLTVAAIGAAGYAVYQFTAQQEELERALNGTGRAAGVTADHLRAIGVAGAASGGFGSGTGVGLAGQYASAGMSGNNIGTLVSDTQRFGRAFGVDMSEAQKEIASIVSEEGLGAFEKRFGSVSFAVEDTVHGLEESGRFIEAQAEKTRLFDEAIRKANDSTGSLAKAWDAIARAVSSAGQKVGSALAPSLEEQVRRLEEQKAGSRGWGFGTAKTGIGADDSAVNAQIADLKRQIATRDAEAARQAAELDANRRSQVAGSIVELIRRGRRKCGNYLARATRSRPSCRVGRSDRKAWPRCRRSQARRRRPFRLDGARLQDGNAAPEERKRPACAWRQPSPAIPGRALSSLASRPSTRSSSARRNSERRNCGGRGGSRHHPAGGAHQAARRRGGCAPQARGAEHVSRGRAPGADRI